LTYFYVAAHLLEQLSPEEIDERVLSHLEDAQAAIRAEWGRSEMERLQNVTLAELMPQTVAGIQQALGEEGFNAIQGQKLGALVEDVQSIVADELGRQALTNIYRELLLQVISNLWVEYLTQMEALRVSIGLEAYAQRDPLVQYKTRAYEMFQNLLRDMRISMVTRMFTFRPAHISNVQTSVQKAVVPEPQQTEVRPPETKKTSRRRRRRRK